MWSRDPVVRQVLELNEEYGLLRQGDVVLAAVSGGADSMCMLQVLLELSEDLDLSVSAAHYHHGLRGAEADRDAAFVQEWCRNAGIPFQMEKGDVAAVAHACGRGIEETARKMRYDFLNRTADSLGGALIATAHNADDNAETLLLHLVRGSGLQGLTGIAPRRGNLIRPLITCTRAEIEDYNSRHSIPHVEDSTNRDQSYSRNYLRVQVMPLLKELNPGLAQSLSRTSEALRKDNDCLNAQAEKILESAEHSENRISIPVSALTSLPEALAPRAVQILFQQLRPEEILSSVHRRAVLDLAEGTDPSGEVSLPEGLTVCRQYDTLIFTTSVEEKTARKEVILPLPGNVSWSGKLIQASPIVYDGRDQKKDDFCLRVSGDRLIVRSRQTGDRLRPVSRPEKTLKKWMIDEKIPAAEREELPVLTEEDGTILGVLGLGAAQEAHPSKGEPAWHITIQSL